VTACSFVHNHPDKLFFLFKISAYRRILDFGLPGLSITNLAFPQQVSDKFHINIIFYANMEFVVHPDHRLLITATATGDCDCDCN
jgi:hypothetical protein